MAAPTKVLGPSGWVMSEGGIYTRQNTQVALTGNTNETTMFSCVVPANWMGANGILVFKMSGKITGAGGTKTWRIKFGGTTFITTTQAAAAGDVLAAGIAHIVNRNAVNSQICGVMAGAALAGIGATGAIDTTADQTFVLTVQLANAADAATIELCSLEIIPS